MPHMTHDNESIEPNKRLRCANRSDLNRLLSLSRIPISLPLVYRQKKHVTCIQRGSCWRRELVYCVLRRLTVLFQELPTYNDKRRGTISAATLRNLQRSRSNPQLSHLFQSDSDDPAHSTTAVDGQRCDTSPVRTAASLSSAYQYQYAAHNRQHTEPIRSSILSNSG